MTDTKIDIKENDIFELSPELLLALFEWPFGAGKWDEVKAPTSERSYDYDREDDYLDKVHSLENRINELERQQDKCDILSDKYDELQD